MLAHQAHYNMNGPQYHCNNIYNSYRRELPRQQQGVIADCVDFSFGKECKKQKIGSYCPYRHKDYSITVGFCNYYEKFKTCKLGRNCKYRHCSTRFKKCRSFALNNICGNAGRCLYGHENFPFQGNWNGYVHQDSNAFAAPNYSVTFNGNMHGMSYGGLQLQQSLGIFSQDSSRGPVSKFQDNCRNPSSHGQNDLCVSDAKELTHNPLIATIGEKYGDPMRYQIVDSNGRGSIGIKPSEIHSNFTNNHDSAQNNSKAHDSSQKSSTVTVTNPIKASVLTEIGGNRPSVQDMNAMMMELKVKAMKATEAKRTEILKNRDQKLKELREKAMATRTSKSPRPQEVHIPEKLDTTFEKNESTDLQSFVNQADFKVSDYADKLNHLPQDYTAYEDTFSDEHTPYKPDACTEEDRDLSEFDALFDPDSESDFDPFSGVCNSIASLPTTKAELSVLPASTNKRKRSDDSEETDQINENKKLKAETVSTKATASSPQYSASSRTNSSPIRFAFDEEDQVDYGDDDLE